MDFNEKLSGRTAVVKLDKETATLSTEFGLPGQKAELKRKIELLDKLRELTKDIDGLVIPRVLNRDELRGEYVLDRAKGYNLTEQQGMKLGKTAGFFDVPTEAKIRGLTTYFKMIGKINSEGWAFRDHKTDSVFLNEDGTITIVDADGMEQEKNPWTTDKSERNGVQDVVNGFFNRGMAEMTLGEIPDLLIPAGIKVMTTDLQISDSAAVLAERLEGYMKQKYDPSKDYSYNPGMYRKDIYEEGMTNFDYDMAEADFYKNSALTSEAYRYYSEYLAKSEK